MVQLTMRRVFQLLILLILLAACSGASQPTTTDITNSATITLPSYMRSSYENYRETGNVPHPSNAIDVFIVYAPESQQYMPRLIQNFNTISAQGKNPVTGQPYANGERPIYVAGQEPTSGSSGSVAQGIINSIIAPSNEQVYHPTIFQPSVSHWFGLINYATGKPIFDLANIQATAL